MKNRALAWVGIAGLVAVSACSLITGSGLGSGIGEACETDDDCQGSTCVEGVCTRECAADDECPEGSKCLASGKCGVATATIGQACTDSLECDTGLCGADGLCTKDCTSASDCPSPSECLGNLCQIPLDVGFIWVGVVEDQGWTRTHDDGRQYVLDHLPYVKADFVTNVFLPDGIRGAVDTFAADGKQVIVGNSFSQRSTISEAADDYPDNDFLVCSGNETKGNLGSYFARSYQSWYLAGFAAASKTQTGRLGFVGSFVTPELIRHIDAFTLGARHVDPTIKVEVRWEGFWFDLDPPDANGDYRETVLANELMDTGCDVITHNSDNGRVVEAVEKRHNMGEPVFSIGNDNIDACKLGPNSCIGVPYWNWGPMYVKILEAIHQGTWDPTVIVNDNIRVNPEDSITNFGTTDSLLSNDLKINLGELRAALADDPQLAFKGPYSTTDEGQRAAGESIGDGDSIEDDELATMCWYVEGVVEKTDPADPESADKPGRVPWGDLDIPPGSGNKPDCRQNQ